MRKRQHNSEDNTMKERSNQNYIESELILMKSCHKLIKANICCFYSNATLAYFLNSTKNTENATIFKLEQPLEISFTCKNITTNIIEKSPHLCTSMYHFYFSKYCLKRDFSL